MIALTTEKTMTVREVAEQLGCNPETIKGHIRELFPGLMANGVATYLTEAQVTVILEKIKATTAEHRGTESEPTTLRCRYRNRSTYIWRKENGTERIIRLSHGCRDQETFIGGPCPISFSGKEALA